MRKYIIGIAVGVLLSLVVVVLAGDLDSPDTPLNTDWYNLDDIWNRLNDGTAGTQDPFTEPTTGPTSTMHTLNEIYDLIGERAFVPKTGQTDCYKSAATWGICTCGTADCPSGQDGDLEKGVAWPNPRFITGTTGVVTDTLTGLVWLEKANCATISPVNWATALANANGLANGQCGLTDGSSVGDWRLPNVRELYSLVHSGQANSATWLNGQGFTGVEPNFYWSSTTYAPSTDVAWGVHLVDGHGYANHKGAAFYVWPVRGGQ